MGYENKGFRDRMDITELSESEKKVWERLSEEDQDFVAHMWEESCRFDTAIKKLVVFYRRRATLMEESFDFLLRAL